MTKVEIYSKDYCPYCHRALALLKEKAVAFEHYDVTHDPEKHAEMVTRANGGKTVPQIFINNAHIGGCDDMMALDSQGKLDALLNA